jgi:hypothetical protein
MPRSLLSCALLLAAMPASAQWATTYAIDALVDDEPILCLMPLSMEIGIGERPVRFTWTCAMGSLITTTRTCWRPVLPAPLVDSYYLDVKLLSFTCTARPGRDGSTPPPVRIFSDGFE